MGVEQYEHLISETAFQAGLDPNWLKAIIQKESNFNPWAVRYEPKYTYLYKISLFSVKLGVTFDTEMQCQKMSWGLGQIMGGLAREQGMGLNMTELLRPEINIPQIAIRIKNIMKYSIVVAEDVFAIYNGGLRAKAKENGQYINQSYVDQVMKNLLSFKT